LAGPSVACWLSAIWALYLPVAGGVIVASAAAIGAVVFARLAHTHRRPSSGSILSALRLPGWWLLVGVLLGVLCGAASTVARVASRDAQPLAGLARSGASVNADLLVSDDPRPAHSTAGRPPVYLVAAKLTRIRHNDVVVRVSARVLVLASESHWRTLLPGQRVTAAGRLGAPRAGDLRAAVLAVTTAPTKVGSPPWVQRAAGRLRDGLQRACAPLPSEPGGLLPGLVDGDTSHLDPAVMDDFTTTGMTHLVAVSGSNVAIIVGAVLLVARWCRAGPRLSAALCAMALVGFVILVRPSPSVLRAAVMGGLGLAALASGRPRAAVPSLAATVAVLVVLDPQLAVDPGFALSVLATAGLLLLAGRWRDRLRARGVPPGLAEALAIPAAAQVTCAPVIAGMSGTVGLAAVPANLLAVPAVAPATVLGVASALLSVCWPAGAGWLAWAAGWPARWLVAVARYGAQVPGGVVRWPAGVGGALLLAALLVGLLAVARRPVPRRFLAVVAAAVIVGAFPVRLVVTGWPPAGWLVVVCDVGQGDAVVLPVAPGQAVVIDTGPEPVPTDQCLHRLGVRYVNLLVLTHFHADHVGGIGGVFRGRSVAEVVTTGFAEPALGYRAVMSVASASGVPVRVAVAGSVFVLGGLRLSVLGPVRMLTGTRSDPNNNSVVLKAELRGRRVLLAGDAEEDEQRAVLDNVGGSGLRADVLKVAHHGSAYQDPEFLDAVAPDVALVSVGVGNSYGHPNQAILGRLARRGARVLRTDLQSDLAAVVTSAGLAVAVRGIAPGRRPP
jgi:competence protein ComEC